MLRQARKICPNVGLKTMRTYAVTGSQNLSKRWGEKQVFRETMGTYAETGSQSVSKHWFENGEDLC